MLSAAAETRLLGKGARLLHHGICRQYWPSGARSPFTVDSRIKSCGRGPSTCLLSSTSRLQHTRESTRLLASRSSPHTGERLSCDALHEVVGLHTFSFRFSRNTGIAFLLKPLKISVVTASGSMFCIYRPGRCLTYWVDKQQFHFYFTQADSAANIEEPRREQLVIMYQQTRWCA